MSDCNLRAPVEGCCKTVASLQLGITQAIIDLESENSWQKAKANKDQTLGGFITRLARICPVILEQRFTDATL